MAMYGLSEEQNKHTKVKRKHTYVGLVFVIMTAIVIGIVVSGCVYFYGKMQSNDRIQPGVFIKDVNVSGLTKDEAIALVNHELSERMNDHLEVTYKDEVYYVEVEQIGAKFDIESCVNYSLSLAKTGNFFDDIWSYFNIMTININIDPILVYDDVALENYIKQIESNLPDQLVQADYYVEDDALYVTAGHIGAGIEVNEFKSLILEAIQDISYNDKQIEIPTYMQYPEPLNLDAIHSEVYREVQNAYFTTEPYAVFADVTGVDFNVDKLADDITENPSEEEYKIALDYTKPTVTVDDLGKEAFPNLLGSFSTDYVTSNADRTTNLRLAASKINGKVIMPGEVFSYNKVVGKRTIAAGYKEAAIYQDGGVTNGLGGGICQISTTLYNAAIKAGMLIEERRNHMFVPSYAVAGADATVVWGSTDFKFSNRRNYPIKIEASVSGGVATVKIYGLKTNEDYDKYNLSIGTKTVKKTSSSLVVESYRDYKDSNGNIVKRDKLYTDTYKLSSH